MHIGDFFLLLFTLHEKSLFICVYLGAGPDKFSAFLLAVVPQISALLSDILLKMITG